MPRTACHSGRTIVARTAGSARFQELCSGVRRFAEERDWGQFHSPKNLSMALSVECAELMEHFQWLTESQSRRLGPRRKREVEKELADIQIYLIRLSQVLGMDLLAAGKSKLLENARKYPVGKAKGNAKKYTDLG
jgi:NTP pyrophosphatase (non-canonical NTP hydrolase)